MDVDGASSAGSSHGPLGQEEPAKDASLGSTSKTTKYPLPDVSAEGAVFPDSVKRTDTQQQQPKTGLFSRFYTRGRNYIQNFQTTAKDRYEQINTAAKQSLASTTPSGRFPGAWPEGRISPDSATDAAARPNLPQPVPESTIGISPSAEVNPKPGKACFGCDDRTPVSSDIGEASSKPVTESITVASNTTPTAEREKFMFGQATIGWNSTRMRAARTFDKSSRAPSRELSLSNTRLLSNDACTEALGRTAQLTQQVSHGNQTGLPSSTSADSTHDTQANPHPALSTAPNVVDKKQLETSSSSLDGVTAQPEQHIQTDDPPETLVTKPKIARLAACLHAAEMATQGLSDLSKSLEALAASRSQNQGHGPQASTLGHPAEASSPQTSPTHSKFARRVALPIYKSYEDFKGSNKSPQKKNTVIKKPGSTKSVLHGKASKSSAVQTVMSKQPQGAPVSDSKSSDTSPAFETTLPVRIEFTRSKETPEKHMASRIIAQPRSRLPPGHALGNVPGVSGAPAPVQITPQIASSTQGKPTTKTTDGTPSVAPCAQHPGPRISQVQQLATCPQHKAHPSVVQVNKGSDGLLRAQCGCCVGRELEPAAYKQSLTDFETLAATNNDWEEMAKQGLANGTLNKKDLQWVKVFNKIQENTYALLDTDKVPSVVVSEGGYLCEAEAAEKVNGDEKKNAKKKGKKKKGKKSKVNGRDAGEDKANDDPKEPAEQNPAYTILSMPTASPSSTHLQIEVESLQAKVPAITLYQIPAPVSAASGPTSSERTPTPGPLVITSFSSGLPRNNPGQPPAVVVSRSQMQRRNAIEPPPYTLEPPPYTLEVTLHSFPPFQENAAASPEEQKQAPKATIAPSAVTPGQPSKATITQSVAPPGKSGTNKPSSSGPPVASSSKGASSLQDQISQFPLPPGAPPKPDQYKLHIVGTLVPQPSANAPTPTLGEKLQITKDILIARLDREISPTVIEGLYATQLRDLHSRNLLSKVQDCDAFKRETQAKIAKYMKFRMEGLIKDCKGESFLDRQMEEHLKIAVARAIESRQVDAVKVIDGFLKSFVKVDHKVDDLSSLKKIAAGAAGPAIGGKAGQGAGQIVNKEAVLPGIKGGQTTQKDVPGSKGTQTTQKDASTPIPGLKSVQATQKNAVTSVPGLNGVQATQKDVAVQVSKGVQPTQKDAPTPILSLKGARAKQKDAATSIPGLTGVQPTQKDASTPIPGLTGVQVTQKDAATSVSGSKSVQTTQKVVSVPGPKETKISAFTENLVSKFKPTPGRNMKAATVKETPAPGPVPKPAPKTAISTTTPAAPTVNSTADSKQTKKHIQLATQVDQQPLQKAEPKGKGKAPQTQPPVLQSKCSPDMSEDEAPRLSARKGETPLQQGQELAPKTLEWIRTPMHPFPRWPQVNGKLPPVNPTHWPLLTPEAMNILGRLLSYNPWVTIFPKKPTHAGYAQVNNLKPPFFNETVGETAEYKSLYSPEYWNLLAKLTSWPNPEEYTSVCGLLGKRKHSAKLAGCGVPMCDGCPACPSHPDDPWKLLPRGQSLLTMRNGQPVVIDQLVDELGFLDIISLYPVSEVPLVFWGNATTVHGLSMYESELSEDSNSDEPDFYSLFGTDDENEECSKESVEPNMAMANMEIGGIERKIHKLEKHVKIMEQHKDKMGKLVVEQLDLLDKLSSLGKGGKGGKEPVRNEGQKLKTNAQQNRIGARKDQVASASKANPNTRNAVGKQQAPDVSTSKMNTARGNANKQGAAPAPAASIKNTTTNNTNTDTNTTVNSPDTNTTTPAVVENQKTPDVAHAAKTKAGVKKKAAKGKKGNKKNKGRK